MRKVIFFSVVLIMVLGSCSSNGDSVNTEPSVPSLSFPTDDLLCIDNVLEFRWNASNDAEGDNISYRVEVSSDEQFSSIVHSDVVSQTSRTFTLEKGATFFWRVRALDDQENQSDFSQPWRFYTAEEATVNNLPSVPELLGPSLGSTISTATATLVWQTVDPDGDAMRYALYFGTTADPPLLAESLEEPSYEVDVQTGNTYYWKIVVTDSREGTTHGPVWNFSVE